MTGVCYFCDMFLTYLKGRSIIFWRLFLRFSYQSEASKQYFLHFQIQAFSLWSKFVCFSFQMFFSPQSPSQTWQHPADWMKRMLGLNSHKIQHLPSGFFFFVEIMGKHHIMSAIHCFVVVVKAAPSLRSLDRSSSPSLSPSLSWGIGVFTNSNQ